MSDDDNVVDLQDRLDKAKAAAEKKKHKGAKKSKDPIRKTIVELLRSHEDWVGLFAFNEFTHDDYLTRPIPNSSDKRKCPRACEDSDFLETAHWMEIATGINVTRNNVAEAISLVARDKVMNPPREYLNGLVWDGVTRLPTWLTDIMGAHDTPFNNAVGTKWCIAGVARIMQPGCFVKNILILECGQDFGKSSALKTMAYNEDWFLDRPSNIATTEAEIQTQGKWIVEFAEFDSLSKHGAAAQKAYLSTAVDNYRDKYGKKSYPHPRQWVGAATINPDNNGYLRDSENVRYWIVQCRVAPGWNKEREIDTDQLLAIRDQLWAEAVHRYKAGEKWWLDDIELKRAQHAVADERVQEDSRVPLVAVKLKDAKWTHTSYIVDILRHYGSNETQRSLEVAAGNIMQVLGWQRTDKCLGPLSPPGTPMTRYYVPPNITGSLYSYMRTVPTVAVVAVEPIEYEIPY